MAGGASYLLYRNTGTFNSPTWNVVDNVRNVTVNTTYGTSDASTRAAGGLQVDEPQLLAVSIDFEMRHSFANADYAAFESAFLAKTLIDLACTDAAIASGGTRIFPRGEMKITEFTRSEQLTEECWVNGKAQLCFSSNTTKSNLASTVSA